MIDVLVVIAHSYIDFDGPDEDGDFEAQSEDTGAPRVVGVYVTVTHAAEACYSFIHEHEVSVDDPYGGPLESVSVYAVPIGAAPGSGRHLASLPLSGSRRDFEAKLFEAYGKAGAS